MSLIQFRDALIQHSPKFGLSLTDHQIEQCGRHYELLLKWNDKINLTRITEPEESAIFHYCESMFAESFLPENIGIADLGSGSGFPGIPLSIINSARPVILVETDHRKAVFLKETFRALKSKNLFLVHNRFQNVDLTGLVWVSRALEKLEANLDLVFNNPQPQSLILFIGEEMRQKVAGFQSPDWMVDFVPIPRSKKRLLAIGKRA